ncbi:IAA-alanine resistance protein 1 [Camellia lanceoleosa]|uniref:IAA-alanine resistance protein 1 n=1 Tax=Camellia lanceoleosa TaxID=1840588 RepID=A0ACC0G4R3_9ERIC|nr:IAA-alanine resistance protein 1 [Camellia lanceoleosa]
MAMHKPLVEVVVHEPLDVKVIASGIVLFLIVEKIVRYLEENSKGANAWNHTNHHHYHHKNSKKLKDDNGDDDKMQQQSLNEKNECISEISSQGKVLDGGSEKQNQPESLRKRKTGSEGEIAASSSRRAPPLLRPSSTPYSPLLEALLP